MSAFKPPSIPIIPDNYKPNLSDKLDPQLDMFTRVLSNDTDNPYSNRLTLWDSIPKFFIHRRKQAELRTEFGTLDEMTFKYVLNGVEGSVTFIPAYNKRGDKRYEYFLSEEEEIVEQILRKMFIEQNMAFQEADKPVYGVKFTIRGIRRELQKIGRTRSHDQVVTSLFNLRRATIVVKHGRFKHEGSILSNLYEMTDEESGLSKNDPNSLWFATFSQTIANGIKGLEFRQYNYFKTVILKSQVARWIFQKISTEFTGCSLMPNVRTQKIQDSWTIDLITIKNESCMLNAEALKEDSITVKKALEELKTKSLIADYKVENKKNGLSLVNVEFTLWVNEGFIKEMKVFNLRQKQIG